MNRESLIAWWQGLATRERALLTAGGLFVVAVVVYLVLWAPPADGIRKLRSDLPQLREQDASMRAMGDEAARLRSAGGSAASLAPTERMAAVRRSLQRAGLWREGAAGDVNAKPVASPAIDSNAVSTLTVGGTVTTVGPAAAARLAPPELIAESNDRVRVRFDNIDYGVWVAWLASTEGELSTRAARVSVNALAPRGPVGHVRAEAVLDWTQPASSSRPRS